MSVLKQLAGRTLQQVWYPFTQHRGLQERDITVIDARAGDELLVFKEAGANGAADRIEPQFDACASWWTQVKSAETRRNGSKRFGGSMRSQA